MREVCCDLCAYWLPQLKECGNTHINKCINKEHFVKVERNCGTCEREIRAKAIDEFAEKIKKKGIENAWNCHDVYGDGCGVTSCEECENDFLREIDEIAEQMKGG